MSLFLPTAGSRVTTYKIPTSYVGLSTSLYNSLDKDYITLLERAIWFNTIGKYEEARDLFQQDLAPVKEVPVVLIEWSKLYLDHGRYGEAYRLLEKPLQDRKNQQDILDRPEWRAIALHFVLAMTRHKGILEPAIVELERTRKWLAEVAVSDYSDIQVRRPHCSLPDAHPFRLFVYVE